MSDPNISISTEDFIAQLSRRIGELESENILLKIALGRAEGQAPEATEIFSPQDGAVSLDDE